MGLVSYYMENQFSPAILNPLLESDCSAHLSVNQVVGVSSFISMIESNQYRDNLESVKLDAEKFTRDALTETIRTRMELYNVRDSFIHSNTFVSLPVLTLERETVSWWF
jgi:hypothetical protein